MKYFRAPSALECLVASELYVSEYMASLAIIRDAKKRNTLTSARGTLVSQLRLVMDLFTNSNPADPSEIRTRIAVATYSFELFGALVNEAWPNSIQEATESDLCAELIECAGRSKTQLQVLLGQITATTSRSSLHLLSRYAAALELFNRFIGQLNLDLRSAGAATLIRSITFSPEQRQAGIGILSYFAEIVAQRYPDLEVGVRIEQHGNRVTLVVETPDGEMDRIERELDRYGFVIAGKVTPEDYFSDTRQAMMLRHKLDIAHLEVKHTRELLNSERKQLGERVANLETNIDFMRDILNKAQYEATATAVAIREIAVNSTPNIEAHLKILASILESPDDSTQATVFSVVKAIQSESPTVFERLNELFVKGAIQGSAGNYLYAALTNLQRMF